MNITDSLKEARELLSSHVGDDPLDPAYLHFTDLLVAATAMQSDLLWVSELVNIVLDECDLHEGLKTQLEGFRNNYERNYG